MEDNTTETKTKSRVSNPDSWKSNKRKKARLSGQAYIGANGELKPGRAVRPKDCSKCRRKCNKNVPEDKRQTIHSAFWGMADREKQRTYISHLIEEIETKRAKKDSRRTCTRIYFLRVGKKRVQVCKGFFQATLDVTDSYITIILDNRDEVTHFPQPRKPRLECTKRVRPEDQKEVMREHIRNFVAANEISGSPKKKRKGSAEDANGGMEVQRIRAGVNVTAMYDDYVSHCTQCDKVPEKLWLYRKIIKTDFKLKFMDPKPRQELRQRNMQSKLMEENMKGEHHQQQILPVAVAGPSKEQLNSHIVNTQPQSHTTQYSASNPIQYDAFGFDIGVRYVVQEVNYV